MNNRVGTRRMSTLLYLAEENQYSEIRLCSEFNLGTQDKDIDCQKQMFYFIILFHILFITICDYCGAGNET